MTALHSAAVQCGTNFPLLGNYVPGQALCVPGPGRRGTAVPCPRCVQFDLVDSPGADTEDQAAGSAAGAHSKKLTEVV